MKKLLKARLHLRIVGAVACSLALSTVLSGCMPYTEIKQESIVEGVGIDSDGNGGYDLTFQIYNPEQSGGGGGGGQSGKSSSTSQVKILQSNGATLFDAVRNATLQVGRKLYFSNNRAYIIGQDVCTNDFSKLLDFMERNEQVQDTEHIYVAKGKASDILTYKNDDQYVPAENFEAMSESNIQTSKIANVPLFDTFIDSANGITDIALPATSIQTNAMGDQILSMDGTAVFHNNSLVGYMNDSETRGLLWIKSDAEGGVLNVNLPQGGVAGMTILGSSSNINVKSNNGTPSISVKIKLNSKIAEIQSPNVLKTDDKFTKQLETLENNVVKTEAQSAIDSALKTYNADIFGFGLNIYEDQPQLWQKLSKDWKTTGKNINVDISVDSKVEYTGLNVKTDLGPNPTACINSLFKLKF
jgi:spore germination protein KC